MDHQREYGPARRDRHRTLARVQRVLLAAALVSVAPAAEGAGARSAAAPASNAPSAAQVRAGEWWLSEMGIQKAWSVTKGAGVTVGLLDNGVDPTHPDLKNALVAGKDFSGEGAANGEKPVGVGSEHGTSMAAYIAGRGHDGVGMIGAAPEAKVMSASYTDSASAGLRYLVDRGVGVINMSFGGQTPTTADIAYAESHDVVLIAATGNDGGTFPDSPANQFGVVSVSGVLKDLTSLASGATHGAAQIEKGATTTTDQTQGTAVAGPFSSVNGQNDLLSATTVAAGTYALSSGTSDATAIVSGIVALIRAAHPKMDAANVVNLLISTASLFKHGSANSKIGFGVPDAYAAVTSTSVKAVCENPLGSQATKSLGIWPATLDSSYVYKPACESGGSSSASPTSSAASSSGSVPTSAASSDAAASSSGDSSGGVPVWVIVLIVVVVLVAIGLALMLRSRGKRGGPGGPPQGPPAGGGYGPPPGSGPYGGPQPQGPPPGGWQPGPAAGGWQPGS